MTQKSIFKICLSFILLVQLRGQLNAQSKPKDESSDFPAPSCFGQPMPNFELPQFTDLKDQSSEGTCYSYAAVASIEAALYRQTGQKKALSREYSTVLSCVKQAPIKMNERQRRIGDQTRENNFFNSGNEFSSVKNLLDRERAPWDLSPQQEEEAREAYKKLKNSAGKLSLEAQAQEKILSINKIEIHNRIDTIIEEIEKLEADVEKSNDQKTKAAKLELLQKKSREKAELKIELDNIDSKIEKNYSEKSRIICDQGHCFLQKIKDNSKEVSLRDLEMTDDDIYLRKGKKADDSCDFRHNSHVIKNIMRNLCIGVPVTAGTGDTKAGVSNSPEVTPKAEDVSNHAMVITGVKTINGAPHFTFRNSWGERGKITVLGFWDACKIEATAGVLNKVPINGEKISEAQAWVHSDMNKPDNEKEKEAYDFFKSRLGKFIKITDEKPFADDDKNEDKQHDGEQKPPQKPDLKNAHKSRKK